jgi:hypothetical protein
MPLALKLSATSNSIQKGVPLKLVLDKPSVKQLSINLNLVHTDFDENSFVKEALTDLDPLTIKERGFHIARVIKKFLSQ